jgi:hypothetical protein
MNKMRDLEKKISKRLFTEIGTNKLSNNQYGKSASSKGITYRDEFKKVFIEKDSGNLPGSFVKNTVLKYLSNTLK